MEILPHTVSRQVLQLVSTDLPALTCMIWSIFLTASLLGPADMTPLSLLPSSVSLYPDITDTGLELGFEPSSLELFVLVGFVRGDEAGEAVTGEGRGC